MNQLELVNKLNELNPEIKFTLKGEDEIEFDVIESGNNVQCPPGFVFVGNKGEKRISNKHLGGTYIELKMTASQRTRDALSKKNKESGQKKEEKKKERAEEDTNLKTAKQVFKSCLPVFGKRDGKDVIIGLKDAKTGNELKVTEEQINDWSFMYGLSKVAYGMDDRAKQIEALETDKVNKAYFFITESVKRANVTNQIIDADFVAETAAKFGATSNLNYDLARAMACAIDYFNQGTDLQKENRIKAAEGYYKNIYKRMGTQMNASFSYSSASERV